MAALRLCVTGVHGQVASALAEAGTAEGFEVIRLGRPDFDLTHPETLAAPLRTVAPDILVSAAAYTAVDLAESNADEAQAINADAAGALASAAAGLNIPILHLSTDYVFDGTKATPYREDDAPAPVSVYGRSKLAGEIAVAAANPRHVILRTAWVYSHEGKNFVRTMLRLAETNPRLRVVSDQFGCPAYAPDIASAILRVARKVAKAPADASEFGLYHLANPADTSWAGFARAIFALAAARGLPHAWVETIASAQYPTPARRPANSRLDCTRIFETFGIRMPIWPEALARCLDRIAADRGQQ